MTANSSAIRGSALFLMGLATLEELDAEAWFAGNKTADSLQTLDQANNHFRDAQASFKVAAARCALYQQWYPLERREEVTPDVEYFKWMVDRLESLMTKLMTRQLPNLSEIHIISAAIRNEMVIAERKGLAHRGTRHHFPAGHP